MTFFAFGLNHETAPVALREAFALDRATQRSLYRALVLSEEAEFMLVSTCNRTEVYLYGKASDVQTVQTVLGLHAGKPWPRAHAFSYEDEEAIRHVLRVTSGMQSLVLGDGQILAQIKEAYRFAVSEERVGAVIHRLLHTAFRTAKRVITETALCNGNASVSTAAVATARRFFESQHATSLTDVRVLLVGAGQMGRLALKALQAGKPAAIEVTNRSAERTRAVAEQFGTASVAWSERYDAVRRADLVIVASGADEPVLRAERMPATDADQRSTLIIDIAVPRNVDPAVEELAGYEVVDLDHLNVELVRVEAERRAELPAAEAICEEALSEFVAWVFHQQALQPAIHAIRDTFESIRLQEIERHHQRFSEVDRDELDRLTSSIIQKLLAVPVVRLKSVDPDSIDFVRGVKLLQMLFARPDCEDESATRGAHADVASERRPLDVPALCPFDDDVASPSREEAVEALRAVFGVGVSSLKERDRD